MGNIRIPFRGITRNMDDGLCEDGDAMELINAKIDNGALKPIGSPLLLSSLSHPYTKVKYHSVTGRYVGLSDGTLYEIREGSGGVYLEAPITSAISVSEYEFVGNTITASTKDGFRYILFKKGAYYYLGGLPELPPFYVSKNIMAVGDVADSSSVKDSDGERRCTITQGDYVKTYAAVHKEGCYISGAGFRAALRLYNGEYVSYSPLVVALLGATDTITVKVKISERDRPSNVWIEETLDGVNKTITLGERTDREGKTVYHTQMICFKPSFCFDPSFDISEWGDIVSSIEFFTTGDFSQVGSRQRDEGKYIDELNDVAFKHLYSIGEVGLNATDKPYMPETKDVSIDSIVMGELLPSNSFSNNTYTYGGMYSYNNRLHCWGMTELAFGWYPGYHMQTNAENQRILYTCDVYVKIHGFNKDICIRSEAHLPASFGPYIMHPDSKAYELTIVCPTLKKQKTFKLRKNPYLDIAYCFLLGSPRHPSLALTDMNQWEEPYGVFPEVTTSIDRSEDDLLRVSAPNNPFFFPLKQTYQFDTPIVGVQANTIAMSQGQHGQHPLYVFTQGGIFTMHLGSGDVAYSTQDPGPRDVCNNPHSLCALDSAVAFASERGLMLIEGAQTTLVSENIDGFLPSCGMSSPIIHRILGIANMDTKASSVSFRDYLKEACFGYNYQNREIIVSNRAYPYSYVYGLKTGMWHKLSQSYNGFVNAYPYTWGLVNDEKSHIYNLNNNNCSVAAIAYVSRPVKCGTLTHKRILQSALRGILKDALNDLSFRGESVSFRDKGVDIFSNVGFYVLGSNDAEHFSLVAKKECPQDVRDLVTRMNKTKPYKYFMICLVGSVRTDVSLNYVEINIDEAFTNRLR